MFGRSAHNDGAPTGRAAGRATIDTPTTERLLTEIRDQLREQNGHLADIKRMNLEAATRSMAMMDQAEASHRQNAELARVIPRDNAAYFIGFLVFLLILLSLSSSYFRGFWRMLGI